MSWRRFACREGSYKNGCLKSMRVPSQLDVAEGDLWRRHSARNDDELMLPSESNMKVLCQPHSRPTYTIFIHNRIFIFHPVSGLALILFQKAYENVNLISY